MGYRYARVLYPWFWTQPDQAWGSWGLWTSILQPWEATFGTPSMQCKCHHFYIASMWKIWEALTSQVPLSAHSDASWALWPGLFPWSPTIIVHRLQNGNQDSAPNDGCSKPHLATEAGEKTQCQGPSHSMVL